MSNTGTTGRNSGNDESAPLLGRIEDGLRGRGRDRGDHEVHGWRDILEHRITYEWYKTVLTSGAVSLLLFNLPYQSHGVRIFGSIIYYFAGICFAITLLTHIVRFALRPSLIINSFTHPDEGAHVSIFPAAFGIMVLNGAAYADSTSDNHNNHVLRAFFWIYAVLALLFGIGSPLAQFSKNARENRERTTERDFTAQVAQPILPFLLAGPIAATAVEYMKAEGHNHHKALAIVIFGTALQGAGALLTVMYLGNLLDRYQRNGLAAARNRSTMFLASALPAAVSFGSVLLAEQAHRLFHSAHINPFGDPIISPPSPPTVPPAPPVPPVAPHISAGPVLYYTGLTFGVAFWGLAFWWFVIAFSANVAAVKEIGAKGVGVMDVVFGHALFFLANNQLLKVLHNPHRLTVLNEIIGVVTVIVYLAVLIIGVFALATGRLFRD